MAAMHERAVAAAMDIEAKKDSLRQNQDGTWKLVLTVAPGGLPDPIMKATPGTRYCVVFVEKGDNEEPIQHAPDSSEKPSRRFHDLPLSQQAALRCQDAGFQRFLTMHDRTDAESNDHATSFVRSYCAVDSRAQLDGEDPSFVRDQWRTLNAEYEQWAGLVPEAR